MKLISSDRNFYKKTLRLAVPITLQCLITTGVNMMDSIMVGALGETSLSAVSLANQFINIFSFACMGLGQGSSIMASRFWGMQDKDALRRTISISLRYAFALAMIFTVVTFCAPEWLMRMYIDDSAVVSEGVDYFGYSAYCYLFWGLSLVGSNILRSVGQAAVPLFTSCLAFVANVGLNYIFIFGKLGLPEMGVAGAALGTLIARILEFTATFGYLFLVDKAVTYGIRDIFLPGRHLDREFLKVAFPVVVSDSLQGFGNNFIAMITGQVGAQFVAAYSITTVTQQMSSVLTQGVAQSSSVVIGNTLGSSGTEKAKEEADAFIGLGIIVGVVAAGLILILSGPVISIYNISDTTRDIAQQLMYAIAFIILFRAINSILTKGVLRGGGDTRFLMVADIIFLWVASVPLGYLTGVVLAAPAFIIYCALRIYEILKCVLCFTRLRSGKWIKVIRAK